MIERIALPIAAAVVALGLTACGNEPATTATKAADAAAPASVAPSSVASSSSSAPASGYITKKVGERAGISNNDGSTAVDF
ncbi:hypothetical protein [Amycolatopsis jiangsuensis]|uniref:ABC-type glycerol-3-phosphate transport system substrate-binding protein n=1 Tax=Amycolatopsis jiangsuensis TaxID=1181879 RepID=A0A840IXK2_9PSEU|nr:hypothetical protein [Amycolatopsis jiangsuensis]MBB4685614.1 ABC-type glycerol-3-phosphate transport system substrate-binding protein [Amycolatopsis jiangsuensis]